jgi:CubicO group peptidase (beta-lactamase class C family)
MTGAWGMGRLPRRARAWGQGARAGLKMPTRSLARLARRVALAPVLALVALLALVACAAGPQAPVLAPNAPAGVDPARRQRLVAIAPRIDEYLHVRRAASRATGAAMGIVLDGELVYAGFVGLRDAERHDPVGVDTVFRIASLTKSFTAMAALKLRDEGKLELDAPLAEYLPELRLVGLAADAPPPTVRQLLTMTSGLPYDDEWGAVTLGLDAAAFDALLGRGVVLSSAPGERHAYSNLGYALLGRVIAAVSGEAYRDYVREQLLEPLGMRATVWEAADVPPERLATGYRRERDALLAAERPSDGEFAAAGGLYTSVRDYARYMALQLSAYPPRPGAETGPVRRSTLREMHAGQRAFRWSDQVPIVRHMPDGRLALSAPSYGLGWVQQTTCAYDGIVQHGGFEPGYFASVRLLPREALGVVVFSTTEPLGDYETFEHVLGLLREAGVLERASAPPAPDLEQAADALTRLLGHWDEALAAASLDPHGLRSSWLAPLRGEFAERAQRFGACSRQGPVSSEQPSSGRFRLACERGALELELLLTPALPARVQAVHVREELPPSQQLDGVARGLARALSGWDEAAAALFEPGLDVRRVKNALEGLGLAHGRCEVERALWSDGASEARYRLSCSGAELVLGVRIEPRSGKVTRLTSGSARWEAGGRAPLCSEERVLSE